MSETVLKDILEELKAIKDLSTPKPVPPAPAFKGLVEEFEVFLSRYGVVGLAVTFIIGGAAGRLVSALVADILMPVIAFFIPGGAWQEATLTLGPVVLAIGHFAGAVIDFLIIACSVLDNEGYREDSIEIALNGFYTCALSVAMRALRKRGFNHK